MRNSKLATAADECRTRLALFDTVPMRLAAFAKARKGRSDQSRARVRAGFTDSHQPLAIRNRPESGKQEVELEDRDAAADWIDANQLGRRNLTPDDFRLLIGRRYNRAKKAANDGGRGTPKSTEGQFGPQSTAEKLAAQHGTSERTVKRAGKLVEEVGAQPELLAAVTARHIGLGLAAEVARRCGRSYLLEAP